MNCPSCSKTVKSGLSICPHCDAILDDSFLGGSPSDGGDDDTPPPEAPPEFEARPARPARGGGRAAAAAAPKPVRKRAPVRPAPVPIDEPEPEEAPQSAASGGFQNKYSQYWEEDEPQKSKPSSAPRPSASSSSSSSSSAARDGGQSEMMSSEDFDPTVYFKNAWSWFQGLHFEDKLTTGSAAALAFFSMWPWRSGQDGDELGIVTWGFVTLLLAAVAVVTVWGRQSPKFETVPQHLFPKATIGVGGLCALIAAIFAITAFEKQPLYQGFGKKGSEMVTVSSPSLGVFLALLAACGVAVGGFLTMKREKQG